MCVHVCVDVSESGRMFACVCQAAPVRVLSTAAALEDVAVPLSAFITALAGVLAAVFRLASVLLHITH